MHGMTRRGVRVEVGGRVRRLREARGTSVEALSERSDIPEFLVRAIEAGWAHFTFEQLLCLARALGVPVTAFFDDEDQREPQIDADERRY